MVPEATVHVRRPMCVHSVRDMYNSFEPESTQLSMDTNTALFKSGSFVRNHADRNLSAAPMQAVAGRDMSSHFASQDRTPVNQCLPSCKIAAFDQGAKAASKKLEALPKFKRCNRQFQQVAMYIGICVVEREGMMIQSSSRHHHMKVKNHIDQGYCMRKHNQRLHLHRRIQTSRSYTTKSQKYLGDLGCITMLNRKHVHQQVSSSFG